MRDPEAALRRLCERLEIDFTPAMLSWDPGPKPKIDGVWCDFWYSGSHAQSGFVPHADKKVSRHGELPPELQRLVDEECVPLYEELAKLAL